MRQMVRALAGALAPALLFAAVPAQAKNVTADIAQISELLTGAGYTVEQMDSKTGKFLRVTTDNVHYDITFYGCDDSSANCKTVQFYAGFTSTKKLTPEQVNTYARDHRWGIVYLDNDRDAVIEFDVDLEKGGMPAELFLDNVGYWEAVMFGFSDFVYKNDDSSPKKK